MTHQRTMKMSYDGNATVRAILTEAKRGKPIAGEILRICVETLKTTLLKNQREGKPSAGVTNVFTGERLEWSWQRKPPAGALDQCLFFATLIYAQIVTASAPKHDVPLSQSGLLIDRDVLHDLMHIVATDSQLRFDAPFPYSQNEMKRSLEEHEMHSLVSKTN